MKQGYTLISTLLGFIVMILLLQLCFSVFKLMIHHQTPIIDQRAVFELQFRQRFYRTNDISCTPEILTIEDFTITLDRNRIVKKVGYEILLHDVSELAFKCNDDITMYYTYKGKSYELILEKP